MSLLGADVRKLFESILPDEAIKSIVAASGFQERERKLDALRFVRAMIIAASTGYGGRQADIMRTYFKLGAEEVARGVFYGWFGPELEKVTESVRDRALAHARSMKRDLPGVLGAHVTDWHIVDSTTIKLDKALFAEYPGTGDYAAIKVHKRYSVGVGTTIDYRLSPAREHDCAKFSVDSSWSGLGVLLDLGYASLKLIRDCQQHSVHFVIRLKESWKPKVHHVARGTLSRDLFAGSDLNALLADETLVLDGRAIDADVSFGSGKATVHCRLVGVPAPDNGYRFYLTSLPPVVGPLQIVDLYRVRWEIESDNKLNKSCLHLDEIGARTGSAVRALIHASITSSILACLLVHSDRLHEAPPPTEGAERKKAPLHPQTLARAMASSAICIAEAMEMRGPEADARWQRIARNLEHLGRDPNWRRSPSILDQMRGWKVSPGRPKKSRVASAA